MPPETKSSRPDGRGHWPAGARRHDPGPGWPRTLAELRRRLTHPIRGTVSRAALARDLGVSSRTVRRWLSGEDYPTPDASAQVASWLGRHRTDRMEPRAFREKRSPRRLTPKMPLRT